MPNLRGTTKKDNLTGQKKQMFYFFAAETLTPGVGLVAFQLASACASSARGVAP